MRDSSCETPNDSHESDGHVHPSATENNLNLSIQAFLLSLQ